MVNMPRWTKRQLEEKIKEATEDLRSKKRYLAIAEKEVERCQIVLERYEEELVKLQMNPSSREMQ